MYQNRRAALLVDVTITERYQKLSEQHAYERRVAAFGLAALLAPYIVRQVAAQ